MGRRRRLWILDLTLKFPDWENKIKRHRDDIDLFIAAMMQTNRAQLFDQEGAYNGHDKWKKPVFRDGMALSDRGTLRKSIGPRNDGVHPSRFEGSIVKISGETITIGTSIAYAKINNDGGKVVAKNAKALKIPVPSGTKGAVKLDNGTFLFRKSVNIPARNFSDLNDQDKQELDEALTNYLVDLLNAKD